jgi:hypothetical protein
LRDHKEKFWHKPHDKKKSFAEVDLDLQENVRQNWRSSGTDELTLLATLLKSNRLKKNIRFILHH